MKSIIIARVSTEEQKEAGLSLPAQIARLEKYCQNKNFNIMRICSFDESAYKEQRNEFDAIIDFILEQKEKIAVCCDKVDRLTRNMFDKRIATLYERALTDQIELHFVSDGQVLTSQISAAAKFQFSISLGLAKYYSDAISDNVRRAMEQKLRRGEWPAQAPYGYKNVTLPDGKKDIIVDEHVAYIVTKAFELYATGAYSMHLLLDKINQDYKINWAKSYIDKLLRNPFYHGDMHIKGKVYPHRYPPLIEKSLFEQVQKVKQSFNKKHAKYAGRPYIYRGLIRCGHCELTITPEKHKGHVYYHCTQFKGKHDAKWLREEEITRQFENLFKRLQLPRNIITQIEDTLTEVHENKVKFHAQQFDKLTREHKETTTMLDNLYMDKLKGRITESDYDRYYRSLHEKVTGISSGLEQLQEAEDNYYITTRYLLKASQEAYDLFKSSEVDEKRQLIKLVLSNLRLTGENLDYIAQKPFDLILNNADCLQWRP